MKKLTNTRIFSMAMLGLGFVTVLSLSSCDETGDSTNQQEKEQTEESTHMEEAHEGDHPAAESEHPNGAEADTTGHGDEHPTGEEHPAGDEEHPSDGEEHPAGGDEHPN